MEPMTVGQLRNALASMPDHFLVYAAGPDTTVPFGEILEEDDHVLLVQFDPDMDDN